MGVAYTHCFLASLPLPRLLLRVTITISTRYHHSPLSGITTIHTALSMRHDYHMTIFTRHYHTHQWLYALPSFTILRHHYHSHRHLYLPLSLTSLFLCVTIASVFLRVKGMIITIPEAGTLSQRRGAALSTIDHLTTKHHPSPQDSTHVSRHQIHVICQWC